ncbi:MAG TPA: glycosyl hydrolase family 18 protein [Bacillota bacterium]|nr:glycosyl hydrolase family 18 protein [Bacillota bacterium]
MHPKKPLIFITGLFLIVSLQLGCSELNGKEGPGLTPPPSVTKPKILTFYEEGWGGIYRGSLTRLREVKEKVDVVCPVWLGLKANGLVKWDKTNPAAIRFFNQNRLDFLVLVTAGSGRNCSAILSTAEYRRNAINIIASYVKRVKAQGICVDFEYINPGLKKAFTSFVTELKATLVNQKLLVAVFPYVNWEEPTKEAYDYRRLGEVCDGLIVMTYDQHRPSDSAGPIAARDWVKQNLYYFTTQIDNRKLWLGIAGYGYRWQTGKQQATALPAWYCRDLAVRKGVINTFQADTGNDYLQYQEKGKTYTIWWEGTRGMREKLALATRHHLAGVALWRLGYEEKEFWKPFDKR